MLRLLVIAGFLLTVSSLARAEGEPSSSTQAEPGEEQSGGDTTVMDTTRDAFAYPLRNLTEDKRGYFMVGNSFFNQNWVTAPASAAARDGLGPLYQARSCSACHFKDGRGTPPPSGEKMLSMLVRLSIPGRDEHGGPLPEPTYGLQLSERAISGVTPAGTVELTYEEVPGTYADGEPYSLRKPGYHLAKPGYGPFHPEVQLSPRVAPAVYGIGLLEVVPEQTLREIAESQAQEHDGIAGRLNHVWDIEKNAISVGRFGWKANEPTIRQQSAHAFAGDIGITSSLVPHEALSDAMADLRKLPNGGNPEISDKIFGRVVLYARTLAVPGRRDWTDPEVLRGKQLFTQAKCSACHVPKLQTGDSPDLPELANQTIRPYTDLLLHDMGEGLADNRPDYEATGRDWRTAPLWGTGLIQTVNNHNHFLHDGRARGYEEAILWHGGEAEKPREAFRTMNHADRAALVRFLASL